MSTDFMCELCHEKPAKKQWFNKDGQELYICLDCHAENSNEVLEKALESLRIMPSEIRDDLRENEFSCISGDLDDPITASFIENCAKTLLEIGERNGFSDMEVTGLKVTNFDGGINGYDNSIEMNGTLLFDRKKGWVTVSGKFSNPDNEGDKRICVCTFKLANPGKVDVFGIIGESETDISTMYEFPNNGLIPTPLCMILQCMINSMSNADEVGSLTVRT